MVLFVPEEDQGEPHIEEFGDLFIFGEFGYVHSIKA